MLHSNLMKSVEKHAKVAVYEDYVGRYRAILNGREISWSLDAWRGCRDAYLLYVSGLSDKSSGRFHKTIKGALKDFLGQEWIND